MTLSNNVKKEEKQGRGRSKESGERWNGEEEMNIY